MPYQALSGSISQPSRLYIFQFFRRPERHFLCAATKGLLMPPWHPTPPGMPINVPKNPAVYLSKFVGIWWGKLFQLGLHQL